MNVPVEDLGLVPFMQVVASMRHWQKRYFKTRDQGCLIEAKIHEAEVDRRIER